MDTLGTDEIIVERALTGDAEAFGEIVRRWERRIFALAYGMLGREDDARRRMSRSRGESRFGLLLIERRLATDFRAPLSRDALVNGDPVQPRRHLRLAAKTSQVAKSGEKRLLRRVARIVFATKNPVRKREYSTLPAPHQLAKSFSIARQGAFNDYLVAAQSFHSREPCGSGG